MADELAAEPVGHHSPAEPLPVSVVIPAYNRPSMVQRAVRSALEQTPQAPAEVIVVDDCSTDETGRMAAEAGARVIRHSSNMGEAVARNTGFAHAAHSWVALLDSDDEWLPHLLATLWPLRNGHLLVGGASVNCGPLPGSHRFAGVLAARPVTLCSPAEVLFPENYIAASGTMVRRDVVAEVGGYEPELTRGADMDLWIRILERGTGILSPRVVVIYHVHAGQVTSDHARMAEAHEAIAVRYSNRDWWQAAALERWRGLSAWDAARRELADGRRTEALQSLGPALLRPRRLHGLVHGLWRRLRLRRRSGTVTPRGTPTVALMPGVQSSAEDDLAGVHESRLSAVLGTPGALVELAVRPRGAAVVATRSQAVAVRALGIRPIAGVRGESRAPATVSSSDLGTDL